MVLERENLNCRRLRNVNLGEWLYLGCGIWKPRISVLNICIGQRGDILRGAHKLYNL